MQAFLARLRKSQSDTPVISNSSSSSTTVPASSQAPAPTEAAQEEAEPTLTHDDDDDVLPVPLLPPPPHASPTPNPLFSGIRKIHPNQDALLSSIPPPLTHTPSFQGFPAQQEFGILSPPTSPTRRGSNDRPDLGGGRVSTTSRVDAIRESNESEHPTVPSTTLPVEAGAPVVIGSPEELPREGITPLAEGGNLSRSSSRRTTGLFSAVPFSGGTGSGLGWSTFGRNQRRQRQQGSNEDTPALPITATIPGNTIVARKESGSGKGSGDGSGKGSADGGVSRTSSQSRTATTPRTKSTNLSRSGSTKHQEKNAQGGGETYQPDLEAIEHYTRIPIISNNTTNAHGQERDRHRRINDINDSPTLLSRSNSLSQQPQPHSPTKQQQHQHQVDTDSTPSTSSPTRAVFNISNPPTRAPSQTHPHSSSQPNSPSSSTPHSPGSSQPRQSTDRTKRLSRTGMEGTFPPRTTVIKPELLEEDGSGPASLPFTFGRQGRERRLAEDVFMDEFGRRSEDPQEVVIEEEKAQPFPLLGTPMTEFPPTTSGQRTHLGSDSSNTQTYGSTSDVFAHPVPSLISDTSNDHTTNPHTGDPSSSTGRGWPFGTPLPLRGMASFGSSGDELTHPRVYSDASVEGGVEPWSSKRRKSAGSLIRRTLSGKSTRKSVGELGALAVEPIVVMSAEVPEGNLQAFPSRERITQEPEEQPAASTSNAPSTSGHRRPTSDTTAVDTPPSSNLLVTTPSVEVTGPTPRPSPVRQVSTSTRLSELFLRRVPDGHAHPGGIGVAGVEPHSRRQSLKVMGKRKAGDSDEDPDAVVIFDETGRNRTGSNAPSSYMRKRIKLSDASEKDAVTALAPTNSRSSKPSGAPSVHSTTSRPKSIDSTRPRSMSSTRPISALSRPGTSASKSRRPMSTAAVSTTSIPISAIVSPRAPSIRHSIASGRTGRTGGGGRGQSQLRFQDPLKNRVQRRRKREVWADSWRFECGMVIQAYLFLLGFVCPVAWWIGVVLPIRRGRRESGDVEGGEGKGKGAPTMGVVDRSNSGLWTDVAPYEEEQRRLWRGRCLVAAVIGTVFWVVVVVLAVVFSKRK